MSTGASADPKKLVKFCRQVRRSLAAFGLVALAGPVALLVTSAAGIGTPPALAGGPLINGGGSSYAAPAINNWAASMLGYDGDVINYNVSSSVIGLNEFAGQQIDFGASEIGYSTGQAAVTPNFKYQYLPDVAGATCLMYNLKGVTGAPITKFVLNSQVMALIFTGQIKYWNDPRIEKINGNALLPHTPISVVWRTDASGDNYLFSEYLSYEQSSIWDNFAKAMGYKGGPLAIYPYPQEGQNPPGYNLTGWVGAQGSDIASNDVAGQNGAITYVETAYALLHNKPCAYVQNQAGYFVQPSLVNDAVALEGAQLLPDLEQQLDGVYSNKLADTYPISAYSYILTQEATENAQKGAVLGQFILFLACQGQNAAGPLGYSPLPPNLVQDDFDAVDRINGAAKAPAKPTAADCKNPYVDGSIPLEGEPTVQGQGGGTTTTTQPGSGPTATTQPGGQSTATTQPGAGPTGTQPGRKKGSGSKTGTTQAGTTPGGPTTPTTLPAGVINPNAPQTTTIVPGYQLLNAMSGIGAEEGMSGSSVGLALGLTVIVLAAPAILLGRRRARRQGVRGSVPAPGDAPRGPGGNRS